MVQFTGGSGDISRRWEKLETYLVGQYRYPLNTYSWEVPEGGADPDESNLEAAKRELKEETGLKAQKWTYLSSLYTSNSITNEIGHIYLAEELITGVSEPEHTEDLTVKMTRAHGRSYRKNDPIFGCL
jgi:8-oxo-dGTP pyrophosphatase MutT (NUDIX family)